MIKQFFLFVFLCLNVAAYAQWKSHFTTDDGLPSDKAYMTTVDYQGFLWCATDKGIAMYNGKEFTKFTVKEGLPINDIWVIIPTRDGKIWYFGKSPELGYIEKGKVKKFKASDGRVMSPGNYFIEDNNIGFYEGYKSYFLYGNEWKVYALGEKQKEYGYRFTGKAILTANAFYDAFMFYNGEEFLHLNTNLDTIARFYPKKKFTRAHPTKSIFYHHDFFLLATVDNLLLYNLKEKKLLVINWGDAVFKSALDPLNLLIEDGKPTIVCKTGQYYIKDSVLVPNVLLRNRMQDQMVVNYNKDMFGNIWVNTKNDGIYRITVSDHIKVLFEDQVVKKLIWWKNNVYVALQEDGMYRINNDLSVKKILDRKMYWYDLKNYKDQYIEMLGSYAFLTYDGKKIDSTWITINNVRYNLGSKSSLHTGDSLVVATPNSVGVINIHTKNTLKNTAFYAVYSVEKYADRIFLGGNGGLSIYNHGNILEIGEMKNIPVKCLMVWNNLLMIGTDGMGIYITDGKIIYKPRHLEGLVVNDFFIDDVKRLWIATNMGAHSIKYDPGTHKVHTSSILKSQGLIDNNVNDVLLMNDSLYCATNKGLCIINIENANYARKLQLIIKDLIINDSLYDPESSPVYIKNKGNNRISLVYDVAFLSEHEQLRFYYKIEPLNKEWIGFNSKELNFNGLGVGSYRIFLKAEGFNNNYNEIEIQLIIQPRWYEQGYVRVLGIILFFSLLGCIIFIIIRTVNRNLRNRYLLKKRLVDIEQDALRSKLNPHFIFNTLNSIQYFIVHNDIDSSEKYLLLFSNHIRDIFEYSHVPDISLENEIRLIRDYLEIEMMRFEDKISYEIEMDPALDIAAAIIPTMILQPFIENALKHGLLPKRTPGKLSVRFQYISDKSYRVTIMDNGKGIRPVEYLRRSSTSLIEKRIDLLNQSDEWIIEKRVGNMLEEADDKGTIVDLFIEYKGKGSL